VNELTLSTVAVAALIATTASSAFAAAPTSPALGSANCRGTASAVIAHSGIEHPGYEGYTSFTGLSVKNVQTLTQIACS
jgi:hypothetical protein